MTRRCFLTTIAAATALGGESRRFSFAVLTDIQFADQPALGKRDYRGSWERLSRAVTAINAANPQFAIQLGDLVDAGKYSLSRILPLYQALTARQYHVLGNHDFALPRAELMRHLGIQSSWYDFALYKWRCIVLDGMDISLSGRAEGTPEHDEAVAMLAAMRARHAPNAQDWNGAIGKTQMNWLRRVLREAAERQERALVFCHFPVLREASTPQHLLWNSDEILPILEQSGVVAAWMNGHDHNGGYAERHGIHHVTFPGMVESAVANSYTLVDVFDDRLELHGTGTAPSRTLSLKAR